MSGHKNYITIEGCCDSSVNSDDLHHAEKYKTSDGHVMNRVKEEFTVECLRAADVEDSLKKIAIEDLSEQETTPKISNDSNKIMRKKTSLVKMPILQLGKVHANQSTEMSLESKESGHTQHFKEVELGQLGGSKFLAKNTFLTRLESRESLIDTISSA